MKQGDLDNAVADFTEAIRLQPKNPAAFALRSLAYGKKGDQAKAAEDLAQAKKLGVTPKFLEEAAK